MKYGLWRIIYILVFGLLATSIFLTSYFIYQTIYIGIANANAIVASQLNFNIYNLNISSFEKSLSAINQKKQLGDFPPRVRNIFFYSPSASTTYVNSSTQQ